jgi:hypothetical protein
MDAGTAFGSEDFVPITAAVVDPNSPPLIIVNPAGAINMRLPPSSGAGAAKKGQVFIFVNRSGNVVTLQTSAGAGFTTAITVAANGATRVVCTGDTTAGTGWLVW